MTKRRVYIFPDHIVNKIEDEAARRLDQKNIRAKFKKQLGSEARDILCLLVHLAFSQVQALSKEDYERLVKQCKRVN